MEKRGFKKGDWVICDGFGRDGRVIRVARNGAWVDVDWHGWTKRMLPEFLSHVHTIQRGDLSITLDTTSDERVDAEGGE